MSFSEGEELPPRVRRRYAARCFILLAVLRERLVLALAFGGNYFEVVEGGWKRAQEYTVGGRKAYFGICFWG